MKNTVKAALAVLMIICIIAVVLPATASKPTWNGGHYPNAMDGKKGSVTGRVTTSVNGTVGIGGAYIAIVNASNVSEEYYNTTSDAYGNYQITGVNATYSSVKHTGSDWFGGAAGYEAGRTAYKMYALKDPYGEGWSDAFGIDANQSAASTTSVVIFTAPARIELKAERGHVVADSLDNVKITAYMYDALGNPVADGYLINFTVGNATNNTFTDVNGWAPTATTYTAYPDFMPDNSGGHWVWTPANGSFTYRAAETSTGTGTSLENPTKDNTGSTSVQFGWVDEAFGGNNTTVWAYWYNSDNATASAKVFANIKIYFEAPTASWTGYVVDSFGTGYGGIPVMLHVMGYDNGQPYEIYNMTRTTSSSQPFVGLFAFDYIVLQNAAYGYVDASAQLTDNLTIYGASNNYSMNRSRTSIGSIVLRIPPPDAIKVTPEKDTILVGGQSDWIIAQLYLNGQKYKRANIAVTFESDNDTVATLPKVKTNITDLNGQAWILLTSNDTVGKVNITGTAAIMYNHNLSDTCMVRVVGWGTVSGIVTDMNKVGIPNANVTLWNVKWNETLGRWENTKIVDIPENPQLSNDGRTAAIGMYTYYRVPWNVYNVTGEKEGHMWYAIFVMGPFPSDIDAYKNASYIPGSEYGTATHNIAIPDYSYIAPISITPPPVTVTATPATPTPTPTATAVPTPGFETLFALAGLLGVAYLVARKEN